MRLDEFKNETPTSLSNLQELIMNENNCIYAPNSLKKLNNF